ncbi:MAG TPA: glucose 1-dehydrogenase [Candidatus Polarisedimenticolia bacterium]|jgi:NAD(P)-dependent dehydrogenase (short-subunit alcohol dehydrogenase family)
MPELSGKSALVTGGGSGIGRAIALAFAREGARVVIAGRRPGPLRETASSAPGGSIHCVTADVTLEEDRVRLVETTVATLGSLDLLVNSAGILEGGTFESTDLEAWDRTMDINVRSVLALTRLAAPHLIARRGNIVNLSSVAGLRPYAGVLAYCVSKAAVDQLTRCLSLELAPRGVRVNALNPGVVVTNLHLSGGMSETDYAAFLERGKSTHPLGRVGAAEEVASLALFLASDRAGWITGGTFSVDGGRALASAR